jgi:hypothetical protein
LCLIELLCSNSISVKMLHFCVTLFMTAIKYISVFFCRFAMVKYVLSLTNLLQQPGTAVWLMSWSYNREVFSSNSFYAESLFFFATSRNLTHTVCVGIKHRFFVFNKEKIVQTIEPGICVKIIVIFS